MKKFLSVLLTLAILTGIVFALPVTAFAEEGDGIEETYTYYLYNEAQWEEVYFYATCSYNDEVNAEFPGEKLEPIAMDTPTGYEVYAVTVDAMYDGTYFNDGSNIEASGASYEGHYYNNLNDIWFNSLYQAYGSLVTDDGKWIYGYNDDDTIYIDEYCGSEEIAEMPETIKGVTVTSTQGSVFWGIDSVTELRIPKTITNIDGQLVGYGTNLTTLYVDPDNPVYESRGNAIIHKDTKTLIQGCRTTVIPDDILVIGNGAFSNVREPAPETIVIPDSVVKIEDGAFNDNTELKYITIPANVSSIGSRVFGGCNNLDTITVADENDWYTDADCNTLIEKETGVLLRGTDSSTIPDYITKIDDYAFEGCDALSGVTIPDGVTYIGEQAFSYCSSLSDINIPAATTYIGYQAFIFCENLRTITVDDLNEVYYSGTSNAIIEKETNKLIAGCAGTVVPESVVTIGEYSFYGMCNLIKIDLPESVAKIETNAFDECHALRRAVIRNSECEIEDGAVDYETPYDPEASEGEDEDGYPLEGPIGFTVTNGSYKMSGEVVIVGYVGSTAEKYATCAGRPFHDITQPYNTVVYFINSDNWENVTAEAYFSDAEGSKITPSSVEKVEDIEDFNVYALTFGDFYDSIVFSDGTSGEDFVSPTEDFHEGWYYNWADGNWYESLDELRSDDDDNESPDDPAYYAGYYLLIDYLDDENNEDYLEVLPDDNGWGYYFSEDIVNPYRCDYYLNPGDKIKVVYFDGESMRDFFAPNGEPWYEVAQDTEGYCTIYFDPAGELESEYGYIDVVDYVCNHNYNSYGVCVDCYQLAPGVKAGLLGHQIVLDGYIAVEYYMVLSDEAVADADSAMNFMVPNGNKKGELVLPVDYEFDNNENDDVLSLGNNMYIFTCHISAKDIAGIIEAEFTTCGETIVIEDYSVKQYLEYILAEYEEYGAYEEELPLAKAMLNYGTAAQQYFDVNLGNLANNSDYMSDEDRVIAEVDFSSFAPTLNNAQAGVSYYGTALSLKSETAIKHYFYFENEEDVKNLNIETSMNQVEVVKNGGYYEFKIKNLYAQNLDEMITLTIGDTTLTYSAFSFGYMIMNQEGNEELKTVLNAMHEFNVQAEIYSRTVD